MLSYLNRRWCSDLHRLVQALNFHWSSVRGERASLLFATLETLSTYFSSFQIEAWGKSIHVDRPQGTVLQYLFAKKRWNMCLILQSTDIPTWGAVHPLLSLWVCAYTHSVLLVHFYHKAPSLYFSLWDSASKFWNYTQFYCLVFK